MVLSTSSENCFASDKLILEYHSTDCSKSVIAFGNRIATTMNDQWKGDIADIKNLLIEKIEIRESVEKRNAQILQNSTFAIRMQ